MPTLTTTRSEFPDFHSQMEDLRWVTQQFREFVSIFFFSLLPFLFVFAFVPYLFVTPTCNNKNNTDTKIEKSNGEEACRKPCI